MNVKFILFLLAPILFFQNTTNAQRLSDVGDGTIAFPINSVFVKVGAGISGSDIPKDDINPIFSIGYRVCALPNLRFSIYGEKGMMSNLSQKDKSPNAAWYKNNFTAGAVTVQYLPFFNRIDYPLEGTRSLLANIYVEAGFGLFKNGISINTNSVKDYGFISKKSTMKFYSPVSIGTEYPIIKRDRYTYYVGLNYKNYLLLRDDADGYIPVKVEGVEKHNDVLQSLNLSFGINF